MTSALRFVPPAILAALVVQSLLSGRLGGPVDERILAGVLASVVTWRTERVLATLATGTGSPRVPPFVVQ